MSSREPLWFCHECNAEMRPLMVPDPVCASCRSSFVEKIDDPSNDPREFAHSGPADMDAQGAHPGIETFFLNLQSLMDRGIGGGGRSTRVTTDGTGNRVTFSIQTGPGSPTGSDSDSRRPDSPGRPPTMSEFLRRGPDSTDGPTITGPIMAQYLMALLGQRDPSNMFGGLGGFGGVPEGRMGDYVFNQEALDHIITQIMENSNAHRPVPATDEIMADLPREVLEVGSKMLEKDCAVCKEQFSLETEDPDEQVVVTLPCKHPFHEPCIMPWLKSSGTCPVCRHALVPQPEHHPGAQNQSPRSDSHNSTSRPTSPSSRSQRPRSPDRNSQDPSNILQHLFGGFVGPRNGSPSGGPSSTHRRSSSDHAPGRGSGRHNNLPGGWSDELD